MEYVKKQMTAKLCYHVRRFKDGVHFVDGETQGVNGCDRYVIKDGADALFMVSKRTYEDFKDEYINGNNECVDYIGHFNTRAGNTFILWYDWEIDEYYITQVINEGLAF